MKQKLAFFTICLMSMQFLAGCSGSYRLAGENRDTCTFKAAGVSFVSFNQNQIPKTASEVKVAPGKYEIVIKPNAGSFGMLNEPNRLLHLEITAAPGANYLITAVRGVRNLCAYEIDAQTGAVDYSKNAGCFKRTN